MALVPVPVTMSLPDTGVNFTGSFIDDLHTAFGHVDVTSLRASFQAYTDDGIFVFKNIKISGTVTDLYDFDLDTGTLAHQAAIVEAGYSGPGTPGHVFFLTVNVSLSKAIWYAR